MNLERWLVSYADFITLLFAFFVVMYAISQADMAKFRKVSASIKAAFSAAGPVGMIDIGGQSGGDTANPLDMKESIGGRVQNLPAGKTNTATDPDPELQEMKELLEETISLELGVTETSDVLQMMYDGRGLVLRLTAKGFFEEGAADVRPDFRPILDRIGKVIAKSNRLVRVEGHTDRNEPMSDGYPSGWELSAARAAWIARYWMKRFEVDPSRVGVAGYAHHRPLTLGKDDWSKAKNRRVEVIILDHKAESRERGR